MKRLLTFIYGLILFGLGLIVWYGFKNTEEWYRWVYCVVSLFCFQIAWNKLDKATED